MVLIEFFFKLNVTSNSPVFGDTVISNYIMHSSYISYNLLHQRFILFIVSFLNINSELVLLFIKIYYVKSKPKLRNNVYIHNSTKNN